MKTINDSVNLPLGDLISAHAGKLTRTTHQNSPWLKVFPPDEHFRSEVRFQTLCDLLPGTYNVFAPDGIGTKVALIDAALKHKNAARDLIAMTAGDITRSGGLPIAFTNVLDVSTLGENENSPIFLAVKEFFNGLVEIADELKFACIKGETAELSACVSSPNPNALVKFNWAGVMIGINHPDKEITGENLSAGKVVIVLKEDGFRSNGISAVRGTMEKQFGVDWWQKKDLVEKIATPSVLYDGFLAHLNGWYNKDNNFNHYIKPSLICHLSGGSFKSKFFEDILKRKGLSAQLDDLWEPPQIVSDMAGWSGMTDEQLYEKWSCGQGALVVVDPGEVDMLIRYADQFNIQAKVAGVIEERPTSKLIITSKFSGKRFTYQ